MCGTLIAIPGGTAAVAGALWAVRTLIVSERTAGSRRAAGEDVFVGGMRYHATGGVLSGAPNFTIPFGLLEVGEGIVSVSLTREGKAFARTTGMDVDPITVFRPDEVRPVETSFALSGGFRFRTIDGSDARDGLVFGRRRSATARQ